MKVFYLKNTPFQYQIFPEPDAEDMDNYHAVEIDDDVDPNSKEVVVVDGVPTLVDRRPGDEYIWDSGKWSVDLTLTNRRLEKRKFERLLELKYASQHFIDGITDTEITPEHEKQTWEAQEAEARAWKADKSTPTPTLDTIATLRGVPVEILREKAYQKAVAYRMLSPHVSGERQAFEDTIRAAKSIEELDAIKFKFTVPEGLDG